SLLTKGLAKLDKPDRRALTNQLLAGLHHEIRYTGVEFSEASIVPRTPAEIFQRKYGDCKDQAALLVAALRSLGVPAQVALLNTGPGNDVEPELPGLGAFDHAIVVIPGQPSIWVDTTSEFSRAGELPIPDQGRWALIAAGTTSSLLRTPAAAAADNHVVETREFVLSELGPAKVTETTELSGAFEIDYREYYAQG